MVNPTCTSLPTPIAIASTAQLPTKLTAVNYPSWRAQMDALLFGFDLTGYVDGSLPSPPSMIQQNDTSTPNPAYSLWLRQDKLILHAILASTSEAILPYITPSKTSYEAWQTLAKTYANKNRSRIIALKEQLSSTRKDTRSVSEYLQPMKHLADEIRLSETNLDDDDLVLHILKEVGHDFKDVVAAIRVRETPVPFDELHAIFTAHELHLKHEVDTTAISVPTANLTRRVPTNNPRPKGCFPSWPNSDKRTHNAGTGTTNAPRPTCQICDKYGHSAKTCRK